MTINFYDTVQDRYGRGVPGVLVTATGGTGIQGPGPITSITITNPIPPISGYDLVPTVAFGSGTATAHVTTTGGPGAYNVTGIAVDTGGSYVTPPTITVTVPGTGDPITAVANLTLPPAVPGVYTAVTDSKGMFFFDIPDGTYDVTFTMGGNAVRSPMLGVELGGGGGGGVGVTAPTAYACSVLLGQPYVTTPTIVAEYILVGDLVHVSLVAMATFPEYFVFNVLVELPFEADWASSQFLVGNATLAEYSGYDRFTSSGFVYPMIDPGPPANKYATLIFGTSATTGMTYPTMVQASFSYYRVTP